MIAALCGAVIASVPLAGASAQSKDAVLPNGWLVRPPSGMMRETDTMPQGAAASPDGKMLAVVASGFNPATLRVYDTRTLAQIAVVPLSGAFGRPLWIDAGHVLVAGDNADALFDVDVATRSAKMIAMARKSHPVAIARASDGTFAVADDGDGTVRIGSLEELATARPIHVGQRPGPLAFSPDGHTLFATDRASSTVTAIDRATLRAGKIETGLHPSAVLVVGGELYVAASDDDTVDMFDVATHRHITDIFVGDDVNGARVTGTSPNALAERGDLVFVSLGAANSVAVLRDHRIVTRIAAGWYPTDVVPIGERLFLIDGKGERTRPNPRFQAQKPGYDDYIGSIEYGSIRTFDLKHIATSTGNAQGAIGWQQTVEHTIVRPDGPIKHVFFILKENRSYDQVLGDMPEGNGDPKLTWFGAAVTPNQHALAKHFGLFDNAYTSGEVSDSGHNWSDSAFADDYVERLWPPTYGGRRDDDDLLVGQGAGVPRHGYMWDAADAAHVSFRDYGEMTDVPKIGVAGVSTAPSIRGRYDPRYVSWNLDYSDLDRVKEWGREFDAYVRSGTLPQLEYVWLPNDHTSGSRPGKLTPVAYVATNDYAVGQMVDKISHSAAWKSSAIFIIEDDAQDGADHVSDQRTTLYVVSPYARGGVVRDHYATVSVLRTIEIMLGIRPMSAYDAMAVPMYDAFSGTPSLRPYTAVKPHVDLRARNATTAYGARLSATLDFSRPDAVPPGVLLNILAHNLAGAPTARR
jgi:YVTN family beta-propeller protein